MTGFEEPQPGPRVCLWTSGVVWTRPELFRDFCREKKPAISMSGDEELEQSWNALQVLNIAVLYVSNMHNDTGKATY